LIGDHKRENRFIVNKDLPEKARVEVALTAADEQLEEDLSQYPLATANGTFRKEDFFQNKEDEEEEEDEKEGK